MRGWVFEGQEQLRLYERKREFLEHLFDELSSCVDLRTALDVGCGIGLFSKCLSELGLKVTGLDARSKNIAEAKRRYPNIKFIVSDVEDEKVRELGLFDLVLCFGLMYHLENPFRAIRNLHALTRYILIIESMVSPARSPTAILMSECQGEDQSLHYVAFVPSEACLIKMLYRAGFSEVYKTTELPDYEDFRVSFFHRRRRTVVVASNIKLRSSLLQWTPEPHLLRPDIWQTRLGFLVQCVADFYGSLYSRIRLRSRIRAILVKVSRRGQR